MSVAPAEIAETASSVAVSRPAGDEVAVRGDIFFCRAVVFLAAVFFSVECFGFPAESGPRFDFFTFLEEGETEAEDCECFAKT